MAKFCTFIELSKLRLQAHYFNCFLYLLIGHLQGHPKVAVPLSSQRVSSINSLIQANSTITQLTTKACMKYNCYFRGGSLQSEMVQAAPVLVYCFVVAIDRKMLLVKNKQREQRFFYKTSWTQV